MAERGTIYSEDGKMLSTSVPEFDIYIDFNAKGLRDKKGKKFFDNIDSLCIALSNYFKDSTKQDYKRILVSGYKQKLNYYPFKKKLDYKQYKALLAMPLIRLGRNSSGFIADEKSKRLNPYGMLAYRTIGLERDFKKVGLELKYDSVLKGVSGIRTVRYIAGGVAVPIDNTVETETQNGKDIISTIDVYAQEVTENALYKMMLEKKAQMGCAIVMETKTGKIKAIANLGANSTYDKYFEYNNYALLASEPGSTLKLASLLTYLEDKKVSLNTPIEVGNGIWKLSNDRTINDAHIPIKPILTVKEVFESSSNVGMSKIFWNNYRNNPKPFFDRYRSFRLDSLTNIDLVEDTKILFPQNSQLKSIKISELMSAAYGYRISISPLQSLCLYNAVANNGTMVKPYLVSAIQQNGVTIKQFEPTILNPKICSDTTIALAKQCLEGVCNSALGSAREVFKDCEFLVAGKTGTNHVDYRLDLGNEGVYQSSFIGYFPANNPQYTVCVVIKNTPNQMQYYGGQVAAPVFKEIANRLYSTYVKNSTLKLKNVNNNTNTIFHQGFRADVNTVFKKTGISINDNHFEDWISIQGNIKNIAVTPKSITNKYVPNLKGLSAKDAIYLCESLGLKVNVKGVGKVQSQSLLEGTRINNGQRINIELQ